MLRKILFMGSISLFAMACSGNQTTVGTNANTKATTTTNANNPLNIPAGNSNHANTANSAPANKHVNTAAAKPAESGPTRISFKKGETGSTQSFTLAPGASIQFILGVTGAQNLFVTPASKDLSFTVLKGTDGPFIKADDGVYSVETKGDNVTKSEIVFEVKNATSKEINSSIKVEVEDFGD